MKSLISVVERRFSDIRKRNKLFLNKVEKYKKEFRLHEKLSDLTEEKVHDYVANTPKEKFVH